MLTVLIGVVLLVVVAAAAAVLLRTRTGRVRAAAFDSGQAELLRRDVSGALTRAVAPGVYRPGGIVLRGKAAKHFRLAGRTLVVAARPEVVADLVATPIEGAKAKFVRVSALEDDEVAAWEAESIFGPFPRLVVRPCPEHPAATELGASRMRVRLRFPQGGVFVTRAQRAAVAALAAAGLHPVERVRGFRPGPDVAADGDGIWHRAGFVDAG